MINEILTAMTKMLTDGNKKGLYRWHHLMLEQALVNKTMSDAN